MNAYERISWAIDRNGDYSINNINVGNINFSYNGRVQHIFPDILDDFDLNDAQTIFKPELEIVVDINLNIDKTEIDCCICMEDKNDIDMCLLSCKHIFCISCIKKSFVIKQECPLCRRNINKVYVTNGENREKLIKTHSP
jgi:hypothetical protein